MYMGNRGAIDNREKGKYRESNTRVPKREKGGLASVSRE
jgi:hypothetical protein